MTLFPYPPEIIAAIFITGFLMPLIALFLANLQSH
jgi:hypothetical protein